MGQEIECRIRYREQALAGKAYLETDHVLFRGTERFKVLFRDMKSARAEGGVLRLEFDGGPAELELGEAAEKWAQKILNPPTRLQKLGVKPGMTVRLAGKFDEDFLADLKNSRVETGGGMADLIFLAADKKSKLRHIRQLALALNPEGALWVVYPKGVEAIRETDVIRAGRNEGLKDIKVASFSMMLTGLKFVIPLTLRPAQR